MRVWRKPAISTFKVEDLSAYIHAAARSGMCHGLDFR